MTIIIRHDVQARNRYNFNITNDLSVYLNSIHINCIFIYASYAIYETSSMAINIVAIAFNTVTDETKLFEIYIYIYIAQLVQDTHSLRMMSFELRTA